MLFREPDDPRAVIALHGDEHQIKQRAENGCDQEYPKAAEPADGKQRKERQQGNRLMHQLCLAHGLRDLIEGMSILHPFSFVMMGEDGETMSDIYVVDDETLILDSELLKGLDQELDDFLKDLMAD